MQVAIIGAGVAGLACADALVAAGRRVALFDKGRGPGGRMSTRRVEAGGTELRFDHGAQYFTARDAAFARQVAAWEAAGVAARWPAAGVDSWVGTPGMNAPVRAIAAAHAVTWGARIERLAREGDHWRLDDRADRYDAMVVAVPAEQVSPLIAAHDPALAAAARAAPSLPCWTLMAAFDAPLAIADVVRGGDNMAVGWAARDGAKPGRDGGETWVVQAGPRWSAAHLEDTPEAVITVLLAALAQLAGAPLPPVLHAAAHRWRYARTTGTAAGVGWNAGLRLGVCGDWRAGPRIEAAWLSGRALGKAIGTQSR